MSAEQNVKGARDGHNATEDVSEFEEAAARFCRLIWGGLPEANIGANVLVKTIRAGVREGVEQAISHEEAPSPERDRWTRIRAVVLAACFERRHRDDVHDAVRSGWSWEYGMPLPGPVEVRAIVDQLVASGELRLFAVDWTVQRADAGDAAPTVRERIGDTPEEIEEANRIAGYIVSPSRSGESCDPEFWATLMISSAKALADGAHGEDLRGSHVRGFIRYLDRARARFIAEAAKLDAAQARGSWAQPAVSLSSADARAVIRVLAWFLYLCTPQEQPVNPYCREHGIPCPESAGGSDYYPCPPPMCTCAPPRVPEPIQPIADAKGTI